MRYLFLTFLATFSMNVFCGEIKSISRIEFGPTNTLFIADWKTASVHALELPEVSSQEVKLFNLLGFHATVKKILKTDDFRIEDLKTRPGTGVVYVAFSSGAELKPRLLEVTGNGKAKEIPLTRKGSEFNIKDAPGSEYKFFGEQENLSTPMRSITVTDMKWHKGKLYVAGLSNKVFSSTLRVISYPFTSTSEDVSVEMYHTSHDEMETRAPIRQMNFVSVGEKEFLIAAYMCTPLVMIPLESIQNGKHIVGKTIAELGFGNTPIAVIPFTADEQGKKNSYVLVANGNHSSATIPLAEIEKAYAKPSMNKLIDFGKIVGVEVLHTPTAGIHRIDNLDEMHFVAIRRNLASGKVELVSINKAARLRISDYVSEYNFPGYEYKGDVQAKYIKPFQDWLKKEEGFSVTESLFPNGPLRK